MNSLFFGTVMFSQVSGNDKAPYLVIAAASISLIAALGILLGGKWKTAMIIAIPIVYTGIIFALARQGYIDSQLFLGFR